jgi:hypothetical protein
MEVLLKSEIWWNGPAWLSQPDTEWPDIPQTGTLSPETLTETKPIKTTQNLHAQTVDENAETSSYGNFTINPTRYSRWSKLLRITAYVFLAVAKFCKRIARDTPALVSAERLDSAENYWIQTIQLLRLPATVASLKKKELPPNDPLRNLDPYIDETTGLLRVGGRLQHSQLPDDSKHPIILPHHDWVTRLIIDHVHKHASHVGLENTHSLVRQKYWLLHGKRELKRILHDCYQCVRATKKPATQKMAPLPKERVVPEECFSTVGVDFAGPLYIRSNCDNSKTTSKAYICLFTCATSRMIHLELCTALTTYEFLNAFRRMTNRRGLCHTIISDNALTFKAADHILKMHFDPNNQYKLNCHEINTVLATLRINRKFITERAPWQGGFYERMVRSVKKRCSVKLF